MSRILFFVTHPEEDAGYRYRTQQFIPYLKNAGHDCTIRPFSTSKLYAALRSEGQFCRKIADGAYCTVRRMVQMAAVSEFDLIVIQREVFPFFAPVMERWVLFRHPKVVFSFDDAVYAGHGDIEGLQHPVLYRLKYTRGVNDVIRNCYHVIAGNRILAEYARNLNAHVSIIPTVVDCLRYQARTDHEGYPVTVGWVGSRSTVPYLRMIEPALLRLSQERRGKVRFRFYGYPGYRPDLPNCESLPFRLDSEIEDLQSLDVGLMPLADTEWCRGKCAFKAIQYMASGAAAISSPIGISSDVISHNVNGLLADSEDQWFEGLKLLVDHADVRRSLTQAARQTIEASYSLQVWGPRFAALLQSLLGTEQPAGVPEAVAFDS